VCVGCLLCRIAIAFRCVNVCVCVCVCVCACLYVRVCVRGRERERERVCVYEPVGELGCSVAHTVIGVSCDSVSLSKCDIVCVFEYHVCVCKRKRMCVFVFACLYGVHRIR